MAKRLTDTNKYKKPFIRGLKGPYKLLWDFLYHECDHAGIWIVDFDIAKIYLGSDMQVNRKDALKYFNEGEVRVFEIDKNRWFLPGFIEFQYGQLNAENRAHNSVIKILKGFNLLNDEFQIKPLGSPLEGARDKDKDKDMDMDKEGVTGETKKTFEPLSEDLIPAWELWLNNRGKKFKTENSERIARVEFLKLCGGDPETGMQIVRNSIANGWQGLFKLKNPTGLATTKDLKSTDDANWEKSEIAKMNTLKKFTDGKGETIQPLEIRAISH